jgi:mono/diheme cytochrome c family protein
MKQFFTLSALACSILLLAQCSPKTRTSAASGAGSSKRSALPTPEAFVKGRVIYQGNCGKCHKLYRPEDFSAVQWGRILPEMYKKSRLEGEQAVLVDAYVMANAKKG